MDCIQTLNVKKNVRDWNNANLSLRLSGADAVRYYQTMDLAKARNPYAKLSDVIRELIGLNDPDLLSPDEIYFFRTGKKHDLITGIPVATKAAKGIPLGNIHNVKKKTG